MKHFLKINLVDSILDQTSETNVQDIYPLFSHLSFHAAKNFFFLRQIILYTIEICVKA